ncbi:MAG: O-acetylhomoserine aminocarboxypropyltransferase/cysteine synthase family protein [Sarcina sp.]
MSKNIKEGTICVQGGYSPKSGEPRVLPIFQSTTYKYDDPETVANLFDLKEAGHLYTRISNPTLEALEKKFTDLEHGVGAVSVSSGQSAILLAILNLCNAGDNIISSVTLYGGTYNLFATTLKNWGIETRFFNPESSDEEISKLVDENTKAIYGETIGNPGLNVLDFEKFARISKNNKIPFIVDNTVASPCLCNPIDLGANVVIHSTSKYSDGHATALGGIIVDGGNFDWEVSSKFKQLVEPDPSYHGIKYVENFGNAAYITKLRVTLLRDFGCTLSPFNGFLTNLGLETLHLRIKKHSENALALGRYLEKSENVAWVNYPFLESNEHYQRAKETLRGGASGLLTFGIKGGVEAAKKFTKALNLVALVVHLGDARTSLIHPASTTHSQLTEEEQIASGVLPDLIRVSVGIEDVEDIINDFEQAFRVLGE